MFLADCMGTGPWLSGCGNVCIPADLAKYTTIIYNAIKIIVPLALIFIGMFDMAKAITSKSEDEIKKAQQLLVKKAVAGALVFVLFSVITWLLSILSATSGDTQGEQNIIKCMNTLFDYKGDSDNGSNQGYTDANSVCKSDNYKGALKIYYSNGAEYNDYYYMCYDYDNYDSKCKDKYTNEVIGDKYKLSDGNSYCVIITNNNSNVKVAVIQDKASPIINLISASTTQECDNNCKSNNYANGYLISDQKCLCTKRIEASN